MSNLREHPFSTYAKYSEKLTFLTPRFAHVRRPENDSNKLEIIH